jgi:ABC-type phosphate transport system substrate-binding protein
MRKRRLLLAASASLATLVLTVGTALADPPVSPPPAGTVTGSGAQTTQGVLNDLCNNNKVAPVKCAS